MSIQMIEEIQTICEDAIETARDSGTSFGISRPTHKILALPETHTQATALAELEKSLTVRQFRHISRALVRFAFFIQLVELPGVNTTRYQTRWTSGLAAIDPRRSTAEECLCVLRNSAQIVLEMANDTRGGPTLATFLNNTGVTLELPVDYKDRKAERLHSGDNLVAVEYDLVERLNALRLLLLGPSNPERDVFDKAFDKVRVKSYLTDRAQTGQYKTNREWRWETPPNSVHFAFRRDCMEIESELLSQLCRLHDLPADLISLLEAKQVRSGPIAPTRCPVTQDLLSYSALAAEMLDPSHGRSEFHVGHLNPLKANNDDPHSGHTASNVSWISADGNRIQGHLGLDKVVDLLKRIAGNYRKLGRPLD